MDSLTGKTAKKQYALAAEAQAAQRQALADQQEKLALVEAGQKRLRRGGGGGLLAYIDRRVGGTDLGTTLGGGVASV